MTHNTRLAIIVAMLLPGMTATAEPPTPAEDITQYAFEDDLVHGDLVGTDVEVLHVRSPGERKSLIRVREHYIDRLLKSIENL